MNRIRVVGDRVEDLKISKKITFSIKPSETEFDIATIQIEILKDCELEFDIESISKKWKVTIEVFPNITSKIILYQSLEKSKIQYNYQIHENSKLEVFKFQDIPVGKEMVSVHLLEKGASLDYYFKDICKGKETLDYYIYHDEETTNSNIKNNMVTIGEGNATVQVSTFIPKGKKASVANQSNRIISFNDKMHEIRPNLYIDEYDVVANHSALIGKFSGEEMFYLQSRGISKIEASRLLLKGFLLSDISDKKLQKKIESATKKEWR